MSIHPSVFNISCISASLESLSHVLILLSMVECCDLLLSGRFMVVAKKVLFSLVLVLVLGLVCLGFEGGSFSSPGSETLPYIWGDLGQEIIFCPIPRVAIVFFLYQCRILGPSNFCAPLLGSDNFCSYSSLSVVPFCLGPVAIKFCTHFQAIY